MLRCLIFQNGICDTVKVVVCSLKITCSAHRCPNIIASRELKL
jgi:hypothetical protein